MLNIFDIKTKRAVDKRKLGWPYRATDGAYLGGNQFYCDFRRASWTEVAEALECERFLIERSDSSDDPLQVLENEDEEEVGLKLKSLDVGVASTVLALAAARCIPCASCNGGIFGDHHHEDHPLVVFFARENWIPALLEASEIAGVGLENATEGALITYTGDIKKMLSFAAEIFKCRKTFSRLRTVKSKVGRRSSFMDKGKQLSLNFW
jgi:hypothetical protein